MGKIKNISKSKRLYLFIFFLLIVVLLISILLIIFLPNKKNIDDKTGIDTYNHLRSAINKKLSIRLDYSVKDIYSFNYLDSINTLITTFTVNESENVVISFTSEVEEKNLEKLLDNIYQNENYSFNVYNLDIFSRYEDSYIINSPSFKGLDIGNVSKYICMDYNETSALMSLISYKENIDTYISISNMGYIKSSSYVDDNGYSNVTSDKNTVTYRLYEYMYSK